MRPDQSHLLLPFFDDVHRQLGTDVAAWASATAPRIDESDDRAACRTWVKALGDAGFLRWCVPSAYGGALAALDSRALVVLRETLAFYSPLADFAFAMQGLGSGAMTLALTTMGTLPAGGGTTTSAAAHTAAEQETASLRTRLADAEAELQRTAARLAAAQAADLALRHDLQSVRAREATVASEAQRRAEEAAPTQVAQAFPPAKQEAFLPSAARPEASRWRARPAALSVS